MQKNNKFYLSLILGLVFGLSGFNNIKSGNCCSSRKESISDTSMVHRISFVDLNQDGSSSANVRYVSEDDCLSEYLGLGGIKRTYGYKRSANPEVIRTTIKSDDALRSMSIERRGEHKARRQAKRNKQIRKNILELHARILSIKPR